MKLIITRHGETIENQQKIMQGHLPGKLSRAGKEQARKVAERPRNEKIDCIYSSDLARAAVKIKRQRKTPLNDTKHAVIAKRAKARFLVTRNIKDFVELQDLIEIRYPESL